MKLNNKKMKKIYSSKQLEKIDLSKITKKIKITVDKPLFLLYD